MKHQKIIVTGQKGFTLLEVLVAVLVVAIGLLGLTKMQALALSSSKVSSSRSIVAMQASSLASSMHAAKMYWGDTKKPVHRILEKELPAGNINCMAKPCTAAELAEFDLSSWSSAMFKEFPTYATDILCKGTPVSCVITINWTEKAVTSVNQAAAKTAAASAQTYVLYVQP